MTSHVAVFCIGLGVLSPRAFAHCDTLTGPVVEAARVALVAGDERLVLYWVRPADEAVVREAFKRTMAVRVLGPEAQAVADRAFFETVVRLHREAEGAPYTGLSERPVEPILATLAGALERGNAADLERGLVEPLRAGLAQRFAAASAARSFKRGDVAGGRAFVAAYAPLASWVEGVQTAIDAEKAHSLGREAGARPAQTAAWRGSAGSPPVPRRRSLEILPWALAGLLALAALVEGAFLLRQHRTPA
jgi:hypothetical protein